MNTITKICSYCHIVKGVDQFRKSASGKYGVHSICHQCTNQYKKEYRLKHKQKIKNYNKLWWGKHPEYKREYDIKNKDQQVLYRKKRWPKYYSENKEMIKNEHINIKNKKGRPMSTID